MAFGLQALHQGTQTNFGTLDPEAEAEAKLKQLHMQ